MNECPENNFFDCDMRFEDRKDSSTNMLKSKDILDFVVQMAAVFEAGFNHIPPLPEGLNISLNRSEKRIELIISNDEIAQIVLDAFTHEVVGNPEKYRMKAEVAKAGARTLVITSGSNQVVLDVYPKTGREKKQIGNLQKRAGENPLRTETRKQLTEAMSAVHKGASNVSIPTSNPMRLLSKRFADVLSRYGLTSYEPKGELLITRVNLNRD